MPRTQALSAEESGHDINTCLSITVYLWKDSSIQNKERKPGPKGDIIIGAAVVHCAQRLKVLDFTRARYIRIFPFDFCKLRTYAHAQREVGVFTCNVRCIRSHAAVGWYIITLQSSVLYEKHYEGHNKIK